MKGAPILEVILRDGEDLGEPGIVDSHHLRLALPLAQHKQILDVLH